MSFTADKQTLDDLNLTGKYKSGSIFNLFNKTKTTGGEKLLEQLFRSPLTDVDEINKRIKTLRYFQDKAVFFPLNDAEVNLLENYLSTSTSGNRLASALGNLKKKVSASVTISSEYASLLAGFNAAIKVLNTLQKFIEPLATTDNPYLGLKFASHFFKDERLKWLKDESLKEGQTPPFFKLSKHDYLLRYTLQMEFQQLLEIVYELDVYVAVGNVAKENGFCYASPEPKGSNVFRAVNMRHPVLKKAVGNQVEFNAESNVLFLTGANMAGKSTLMKTFGISMYLAHMGFPVAAESLEFSIKDGIYSSINVADNLNMGYSHFYAEVLRVKIAAQQVTASKDMVVIFDELFKGTNVKDAYDATLAVTAAFSLYRNCFFVISTHIIEVGDALKENNQNVIFSYLPTVMDGNVPTYPYTLKQGITTDRQGMIIIENEGILDILK